MARKISDNLMGRAAAAVACLVSFRDAHVESVPGTTILDLAMEGAALSIIRSGADAENPTSEMKYALEWLSLHGHPDATRAAIDSITQRILGDGWYRDGVDTEIAIGADGRRVNLADGEWPSRMIDED